ncbi:uncharacterized protein LOC122638672 [Telopea speciosissima]|uniref:uncharacterized protein LOC122638672 n=1 Tax=Telopea speciosissima TaxID=54955 RepID=UPI001CC482DB|nr:uncharacterized protein LOC122638672 [Telopea speciosissima]
MSFDVSSNSKYSSSRNSKKQARDAKITIEFDDNGQPCNDETTQLLSWIGVKARDANLLPLSYLDWRKIPQQNKDDAVNKIYEKFNIPEDKRKWVEKKLSKRWRDFKHLIKSNVFNKYSTHEERLAHLDARVPLEQWNILLETWSQDSSQIISERNSRHSSNREYSHTTGKTPFAVIRERKRKEHPDGLPPSRMELFKTTFTKKDGSSAYPIVEKKIAKMDEKLSKLPVQMRDDSDMQDKIFRETIGEDTHGRVRMYGVGLTPKQIHGTAAKRAASYSRENAQLRTHFMMLQETINEHRAEINELKDKYEMLQAQMEKCLRVMKGQQS